MKNKSELSVILSRIIQGSLILGTFVFIAFYSVNMELKRLKRNAKTTLGITTKTVGGGAGGKYVHYYFEVNKAEYKGTKSIHKHNDITPNSKILVVYDSLNPKLNSGILNVDLSQFDELGVNLDPHFYEKVSELNSWNFK